MFKKIKGLGAKLWADWKSDNSKCSGSSYAVGVYYKGARRFIREQNIRTPFYKILTYYGHVLTVIGVKIIPAKIAAKLFEKVNNLNQEDLLKSREVLAEIKDITNNNDRNSINRKRIEELRNNPFLCPEGAKHIRKITIREHKFNSGDR